ncbi:MAG: 50S ribosomal protein L9 [Sulfuricella denitrificans]|nr:50S ribosomal protein L9 [Sulfuricella denitrificans]
MQVILLEKLAKLGQLGDVVKVKDGYGRNFLIPQKKAKRATPANLAEFEAKRAELEKVQAEIHAQAEARGEKINGITVQIAQKAGVDGRLFGSVTTGDISDALKAQGLEVAKSEVRLPDGPLKHVGDFPVDLSLHTDVTASITVSVVAAA